jgi:hypothetical protein
MKTTCTTWAALLLTALTLRGATNAYWNFNSPLPDGQTSTGTLQPAVGAGTAFGVGGISASAFASGSGNDPVGSDNSGWQTIDYPRQGTSNKLAGVRFNVSTRGHSNIVVAFDLRATSSASRYFRLQYSVNGNDFMDADVITITNPNNFTSYQFSLAAVPEVNDNPLFAIRIVSEFEDTATGAGTNGYVPAALSSSYATTGTVRYDLVRLTGDSIVADNTAPYLSDVLDQTTTEGVPLTGVTFLVGDFETPLEALALSATSSDSNLLPVANIAFAGTGVERILRLTPAPGQIGQSLVTLTVTDAGGLTASDSFLFTVVPSNQPPTLSVIEHQNTLAGVPTAPIAFTLQDADTPLDSLTLSASSSNPALLPAANIAISGSGADRTLVLTPLEKETGTTLVTLRVSDGRHSTSQGFVLMVLPSANVKLCETFSYPSGSLITNSAFFWTNHSGAVGQMLASNGTAFVTFQQLEDAHAPLVGAPYNAGQGVVLYTSFQVAFTALPLARGEYFAHFNSAGTDFRGRIFAGTTNAATGKLRLGVANSTSTMNAQAPVDLELSTTNTVVTRYDVDTGTTTLWVNPVAESDPSVTASDNPSPTNVRSFSLRQNSGIGIMFLDNLKVALSFADVLPPAGAALRIERQGGGITLSWPASAADHRLQQSDGLENPAWTDTPAQGSLEGEWMVVRLSDAAGRRFFRLFKP